MAQAELVNEDIDAARRLIEFLDRKGLPVRAGLWLYNSDQERWRFVISFREAREDVTSFYLDVAKLIHDQDPSENLLALDRVSIVDPSSSVVGPLSKAMKIDGPGSLRLSHNVVNGVYLEDAVILRLSA